MATSALVSTLTVLTNISQLALTISPIPELYHVHKNKSVSTMIVSPLVAMWINNHLWAVYAYPKGNIFPLFFVSVLAEALSVIYIVVYTYWCTDRVYVAKAVGLGLIIFIPVTLYLILAQTGVIHQTDSQVANVLGYLAVVMNFVLYLSPLEKIKHVIVTKSSASIPVLMCSAIVLNTSLWLTWGIVKHDMYLLVPNSFGVVLSSIQVVLYLVYRQSRHELIVSDGSKCVEIEMRVGVESSCVTTTFQSLGSPVIVTVKP